MKTTPFQPRKIAILGASGKLGKNTVSALLSKGVHTITAITRADSAATFPEGVTVHRGDYADPSFRRGALEGQDVLIMQVAVSAMDAQDDFVRSAADAGVPWILPSEYGVDRAGENNRMVKELPILHHKPAVRRLIENLGVSAWVAVITNPWLEHTLRLGALGIDVPGRKGTVWGSGFVPIPFTTLKRAGEAIAVLVSAPDEKLDKFRNGFFYVQSFYITQLKIFETVMEATDTVGADWNIKIVGFEDAYGAAKKRTNRGDMMGFVDMMFILHFVKDSGGDYSSKVTPNAELGLPDEDLGEVIKNAVVT